MPTETYDYPVFCVLFSKKVQKSISRLIEPPTNNTEKQAERSQLYPFGNHLLIVPNPALGCHWRVLLLRHPHYARPVAAKLADNKTAWERHWRVLLLRHPRYARLMAAKLADNKTTFCHSRTYVRDLIFRDILRFFRASPQQNVSSLRSIEMTDSRFDLAYIELRL